jgi:hypothetical protein
MLLIELQLESMITVACIETASHYVFLCYFCFDSQQRMKCPVGGVGGVNAVQTITCDATDGYFTLEFRGKQQLTKTLMRCPHFASISNCTLRQQSLLRAHVISPTRVHKTDAVLLLLCSLAPARTATAATATATATAATAATTIAASLQATSLARSLPQQTQRECREHCRG